jgi:hypothetical protein
MRSMIIDWSILTPSQACASSRNPAATSQRPRTACGLDHSFGSLAIRGTYRGPMALRPTLTDGLPLSWNPDIADVFLDATEQRASARTKGMKGILILKEPYQP